MKSMTDQDDNVRRNPALEKWYLDVVDASGHVFIGYWAALQWHHLAIQLQQNLWQSPGSAPHSRLTLSSQPRPVQLSDQAYCWRAQEMSGRWVTAAAPIHEILLEVGGGHVSWHCLQPKAIATVALPHKQISGWGYVEKMEMTIPLWDLPFSKLQWGRCHSSSHYLVWIKWDGPLARMLLWHNGRFCPQWQLVNNVLQGPGFLLRINEAVPIRQGRLIDTVFGSLGKITRHLPGNTFLADERKWSGRGQMETVSGCEDATVIFEEVLW